jgi:Protein of unknown function (DUF3830)
MPDEAMPPVALLRITVGGDLSFVARLERGRAPGTCEAFVRAQWSGEAAWIPLGDFHLDVGAENQTSHPSPGEILFHPRGRSETEILFPFGHTVFSSKVGQLVGNHFLTVVEGREQLAELGRRVLWEGAQEILFEER